MKTFEQFIYITEGISERINKMSDAEFEDFMNGRHPREAETFRRYRTSTNPASRTSAPPSGANASTSSSSTASGTRPPGATPPGSRPPGATPPGATLPGSRPRGVLSSASSRYQTVAPPSRKTPPTWMRGAKTAGGMALRLAGPIAGALDVYDEYGQQKARGRSTPAAVTMGLTKAAGGWAGGLAGAKMGAGLGAVVGSAVPVLGTTAGAAVGGALGGLSGYMGGSGLAGSASETIAGATRKEKIAAAIANRRRQTGGGLSGIGGQTTFSQTRPGGPSFMSTGVGRQRRTAQLASTSLVRDPRTNKLETGYLAFRTDPTGRRQAVYKRGADPSTLARTSTNWLERVGRTISPSSYAAQDERVRRARLMQASRSDIQRQQTLGVAGSRNLVGPRIVGPRTVGP